MTVVTADILPDLHSIPDMTSFAGALTFLPLLCMRGKAQSLALVQSEVPSLYESGGRMLPVQIVHVGQQLMLGASRLLSRKNAPDTDDSLDNSPWLSHPALH
jgi:hypothetical protein